MEVIQFKRVLVQWEGPQITNWNFNSSFPTQIGTMMENIESSWNILMDINFKILQSNYFNEKFSTYIL